MTFSELFAGALGTPLNPGSHCCFWCGASCDESAPVKVSGTFWDWDAVAFPRSQYQCAGCCECLVEKRPIPGRDRPQKTRNWSWHVTESTATPVMVKADLPRARLLCLDPPSDTHWGFAIADSGQKHILYRTPVNLPGATTFAVQLELTPVVYDRLSLSAELLRCALIASRCGKPSLSGPMGARQAINLSSVTDDPDTLVRDWNARWNSPLTRLAAFLCPAKGDCDAYLANADG